MNTPELNAHLSALRTTLPHGCLFQFHLSMDGLYIEKLTIPAHVRGVGTEFMEKVIAAADEAELPVSLHARSTGRSPDPSQSKLESWYAKLGFVALADEDEGCFMHRSVERSKRAVDGDLNADHQGSSTSPLETLSQVLSRRRAGPR